MADDKQQEADARRIHKSGRQAAIFIAFICAAAYALYAPLGIGIAVYCILDQSSMHMAILVVGVDNIESKFEKGKESASQKS